MVNEFSRDVGADVFASWEALRKQAGGRLNGLVLDLRSNPGGSLDEAASLLARPWRRSTAAATPRM